MKKTVWQEDKLNLLKNLIEITRKDFLTVLQLIILILIAGGMYFAYLFLNAKIEQINHRVNPDETSAVIESNDRDLKVKQILTDLRDETKAGRAKLYQFHNSQRSIGDVAFLYASVTNEVVNVGVSSEIQNTQRLPSSIFTDAIKEYREGKTRCIQTSDAPSDVAEAILQNQGTKIACGFAVYDTNDIVGIVSINYTVSTEYDRQVVDQALRKASIRLSDALAK